MKLSEKEINILKLIERSEDEGDGWRSVSRLLYPIFVRDFSRPELIEAVENSDGSGRVRYSERGKILMDYL